MTTTTKQRLLKTCDECGARFFLPNGIVLVFSEAADDNACFCSPYCRHRWISTELDGLERQCRRSQCEEEDDIDDLPPLIPIMSPREE